jgi:hypothetical protein
MIWVIHIPGPGWNITGYFLRLISRELWIFIELGLVNLESIIDLFSSLMVVGTEYAPGPGTFIIDYLLIEDYSSWNRGVSVWTMLISSRE